MWDPESQTYLNGIIPSHHTAIDIDDLLALNNGKLKIFGYGSLCWHPGSDGVLSLANIEEDELDHGADGDTTTTNRLAQRKVTTAPGRAIGYQRCWSQRSADHRGTTKFNGIVCTLLSDEEVWRLHNDNQNENGGDYNERRTSMMEGLIYTVDVDLVDECLAELDFREKGGYARDVIEVVEDDTGNTVKALLYRGTPDNPAFWKRVLLDLPLAAAIISVAIGPSGPNDIYLLHLHKFLTHAAQHSPSAELALKDHSGDFTTGELANMVTLLQLEYRPYFLFGAGSNEHDQLLLNSNGASCEEVHELAEMLLIVPRRSDSNENNDTSEEEEPSTTTNNGNHEPKSLHAGGGHSALLTNGGDLYLWGWNDAGQLGRQASTALSSSSSKSVQEGRATASPFNHVQSLLNIKVDAVDLGHTHTLVIEKDTGRIFGFGENGRGQVNGRADGSSTKSSDSCHVAQTPVGLSEDQFVDVGAGLFHSAAISNQGELLTWGCGRFGQCLLPAKVEKTQQQDGETASATVGRWRPNDGSKLVQVACGRRHTVVLDEHGRVWTLGDNKYGQLGRHSGSVDDVSISNNTEPQLVDGPLGEANSGCFAICSGWSHILAITRGADSNKAITMYGWGRNDKGQLGVISAESNIVSVPQVLNLSLDSNRIPTLVDSSKDAFISIQSACCGAESSHVIDTNGDIYSTGWNEHGNLATNGDGLSWMATSGVSVVAPPPRKAERKIFAAGGAHVIAMAK